METLLWGSNAKGQTLEAKAAGVSMVLIGGFLFS